AHRYLHSSPPRRSSAGRYVLTVAHLDHQPANCDPDNLRAWCSVCHLRYDAKAISTKKRLKRESLGQLTLAEVLHHG
ncbi:MAG: hypothetical protein F6K19_26090, partial [Cyanothece sp. SIO1E1]|nr:hypothetical protein [Cyanothece sp. SIO1E1]